jgi:hypothetical protein
MQSTANHLLNVRLIFSSLIGSPISLDATQLILTALDFKPLQCNLLLQVTPESYEQVQAEALFNLNTELHSAKKIDHVQPELPIILTISLRPDLLPQLIDHQENLVDYFSQLNTEQPDHPLLSAESWFVLRVKQDTPSGEIGYRTFWDYVNPSLLFREDVSSEEIADGLVGFFEHWAESNLPEMTQAALSEIVKDFGQELEEQLSDKDLETLTQDAIATVFSELIEGFDRWTKRESVLPDPQERSLLSMVQEFFQQDGWDFQLFNRENVLKLAFQGKHDRWTCYAQTNEEHQHILFYSIFPEKASTKKRRAIAEFLTRANYGMTIGNFELDFNDGEIRYKTSIDVEGDRLTPALIKRLVYTNVAMMDEYLPGIQAVLAGATPEAALQQIEQEPTQQEFAPNPD